MSAETSASAAAGLTLIDALHAEVDRAASDLARLHAARLRCGRGCSGCCADGLTVFEVEAERIRARHGDLLREGRPGPAGGCAFLGGAGECRIYPDRPYVCRTQGLPLRWLDGDAEPTEPGSEELRSICELNEPGPPLEALPAEQLFELGPFEARLATLQASRQGARPGAPLRRVALRALFEATAG